MGSTGKKIAGAALTPFGIGGLSGSGAFEGGGTTSELQTKQFPGVFGTPESGRIAGQLEALLGQGQSPFLQQFQQELGGGFGPQTGSEQSLIDAIMSQTQGQTATRGLGPATQGALGTAIAPTLVGLKQQRLQSLLGGAQAGLGQRGQTLGGLLELAGLAMPQIIAGQRGETTAPGIGRELLSGVASGIPAAVGKCWVADELYGKDAIKTFYARLYANTADSWFLRLYGKFGKSWAKFLSKHTWAKPVAEPIWGSMAHKGKKMIEGG